MMALTYGDPFGALLELQRALDAHLSSDWLHGTTAARGPFPPINIFQQGHDLLAVVELPGVDKAGLNIEVQQNTVRLSGRKTVDYPEGTSLHRRERVSGEFDRSISLPIRVDPDGIKAEYRDGVLALFLPRAESDKPRSIKVN